MWKNTVERDRPHITILRMRSACWTPKATNTYSQYVIITAFPLQQWLHERASMLRFTCIACLLSSFRRQFSAWNYREWSKQCCIALGHRQCKHSAASHWTPTVQAQRCIALETDSASSVASHWTPTVLAQCRIALDTDSASTVSHRTGHRQCSPHAAWQN